MKLEDLIGEDVLIQTVRERFHSAKIVSIYPDGTADLVIFAHAGSGIYTASSVPYGPPGTLSHWWFRKVPEGLEKAFVRMPKGQATFEPEPEVEEKVESPSQELFADEQEAGNTAKPVPAKPVRRPAIKGSRL